MFSKIILMAVAGLLLAGCVKPKAVTQENKPESKVEEFTGNLKEAMAKNLPMKCEWQQNQNSGTSYVKGKKMYVETTVEGKKGFMISKDDCFWSWGDQMPQGVKICNQETEEPTEEETNAWDQKPGSFKAEGIDWKTEYKCSPAIFGDEKFELPAGVKFQDIAEMMQGFGQTAPSIPAVPAMTEAEAEE